MTAVAGGPSAGSSFSTRSHIMFVSEHLLEDHERDPAARARLILAQLHEQAHWVHHHGSTSGLWLTHLRRTRDALAREWLLGQLSGDERRAAQRWRDAGKPLISFADDGTVQTWLGSDPQAAGETWLHLHQAVLLIEQSNGSSHLPDSDQATLAVLDAVVTAWMNEEHFGGLPFTVADPNELMPEPVDLVSLDGSNRPLSTALMSECASALDESLLGDIFPALSDEDAQRLARKLSHNHPYGRVWRLANEEAGYSLSRSTMLVLLDFALNPAIPGVTPDALQLRWRATYPPRRLLGAAAALRRAGLKEQVPERPDHEDVKRFRQLLCDVSGLTLGTVPPRSVTADRLEQVIRERDPGGGRFYAAAQFAGEELLSYREMFPHLCTHVSSQYLRPDGAVKTRWRPLLFPPIWVNGGELRFRGDVSHAAGTALLVATAVACAVDDVMTGTGNLTRRHLPQMVFDQENAALREAIESGLEQHIGLSVRF